MPTTHNSLKISLSKEYIDDYGLKRWLNIEMPANFPETENPIPHFEETFQKMQAMYDAAERNKSPKKETIGGDEDIIAGINSCDVIETEKDKTGKVIKVGLDSFKLIAPQKKSTLDAFNKRLAQLQVKPKKNKKGVQLP